MSKIQLTQSGAEEIGNEEIVETLSASAISEVSDEDKNLQVRLGLMFAQSLLHSLAADGTLDMERLADAEYIGDLLRSNIGRVGAARISVSIHEDFVTAARELFDTDRREAGIVLLATAVEQTLNSFYREALRIGHSLSQDEITEAIRGNNVAPKVGWLLSLVAGYKLDGDFRKSIISLMDLRNQIVHYKAVPSADLETGSYDAIRHRIDQLDPDSLFGIPGELDETLGQVLTEMNAETYGGYKQVQEAFTQLFETSTPEELVILSKDVP